VIDTAVNQARDLVEALLRLDQVLAVTGEGWTLFSRWLKTRTKTQQGVEWSRVEQSPLFLTVCPSVITISLAAVMALVSRDDDVESFKMGDMIMLTPAQAAQLAVFVAHDGHVLAPLTAWLTTPGKGKAGATTDGPSPPSPWRPLDSAPPAFPPPSPPQALPVVVQQLLQACTAVLEAPGRHVGARLVAQAVGAASPDQLEWAVTRRMSSIDTAVLVTGDMRRGHVEAKHSHILVPIIRTSLTRRTGGCS